MDIAAWLAELGLEQYAKNFAVNDIDAGTVTTLDGDDLKELGVASLGHRKKLLAAIEALRGDVPTHAVVPRAVGHPSPAHHKGNMTTLAGERRQVTVLFADITGYTTLSNQVDAEELSEIVARVFAEVDSIVEVFGGTIDKHIGDEVMALFGAPIAHDDDPVRAVRAALEIHRAMNTIAAELDRDLSLHIGIASGSVVAKGVGAEARNEYTVMGPSVNLAARLNAKAKGRETIVSGEVRQAAGSAAEFESLGTVEVKGFDKPVAAWRAVEQAPGKEIDNRGALVGRRGEMRQLASAMEACAEAGTGQCILVRGEAGMGKSRLTAEFSVKAAAAGFSVHKGLVLDFGVGRGQDALRAVVASVLGLPLGCSEENRKAAADKALASGIVDDDDRPFLNDFLDVPQSPDERARFEAMNNDTRNARTFAFIASLIEHKSAEGPMLVIVEDIHWADGPMLRCVAAIASVVASCPVLLLMTTRTEGDPLDPAWRGMARNVPFLTIDLGPLRKDEAAEMAKDLIDSDRQFVEQCILRAEGNPLFLEQLLRNSEERGDDEIPASIQSLVLARMDRLAPPHKQALQTASVIGQRFDLEALRAIVDLPAYDCGVLVDQMLVRPEGGDYLFVHALIQQGVYSSLLSAARRGLHQRAAAFYSDRDPVLQAQHLDRADHAGASRAYLRAAVAQSDLYHFEAALRLAERGLEIATDPSERAALLCYKGEKLRNLGDTAGSTAAYREALEVAPSDIDKVPAWIGLAEAARLAGKSSEGLDYLQLAQPPAERAGLDMALAEIHHLRGNLVFPMGEYDLCRVEHEAALAFAERAGSIEMRARAMGGLGDAYYSVGKMQSAHKYLQECIKLAHENGLGSIEVSYLIMRTDTHYYRGEIDAAWRDSMDARAIAVEVGNRRAEFFALWVGAAIVMFDPGRLTVERLHADIERMSALVDQLGLKLLAPLLVVAQAVEDNLRGLPCNDQALRDAYAEAKEVGVTFGGGWILAYLTWLTSDPETRRWAMAEAEALLAAERCISHNYLIFYQLAAEVCIANGDWANAARYREALQDYTREEPVPLIEYLIRRARALEAAAAGNADSAVVAELERLRSEARKMVFTAAVPALDAALARVDVAAKLG